VARAPLGGAVRVVLEMAGIKNAFGKQLGSGNPLNNARATIEGLRAQRTVQQVAEERGLTVAQLMGFNPGISPAICSVFVLKDYSSRAQRWSWCICQGLGCR